VLYEAVSGRLPFEAASDFELMRAHAEQPPPRPPVTEGDLPTALEAVILRMLDKRPERRYASARECLDALTTAVGDEALPRSTGSLSSVSRDGFRAAADFVRTLKGRPASLRAPTLGLLRCALRGLDLPRGRDGPAWRAWLASNPGLAGAAVVTFAAIGLAASFSVMSVCCRAPEVVPPTRAALVEPPAVGSAPSRREPVAIDEPTPVRVDTPRVVVVSSPDDEAAGRTTVRVEGGTAKPAPKSAAPVATGTPRPPAAKPEAAAPEQESWYVRR
jgi:hypothetical protein